MRQNILFLCPDYFTHFQEFFLKRSYLKTHCRKLGASIEFW